MTPQPDIIMPADPYGLLGTNWPKESESAYRAAETRADDAATTSTMQAQSAMDAETKMADEEGQTAEAVSSGYSTAASTLREHAITFTTIAAWMTDAAGKVGKAKAQMSGLVNMGTSEIRDALTSEMQGITVSPSSGELTTQYQSEITSIASKLNIDLDGIGHSLRGDAGSSTTPTYIRAASTPTAPTVKQSVHHGITGEGQSTVEPQHLPEMPRVSTPPTPESPSATSTPAATVAPHPTLSNLVAGSGPSGTPTAPSAKSPSPASSGTPAGQQQQPHQPTEQRQALKSAGLPRIPSAPLPDLPVVAADIGTAVSSAAASHQLPTPPSTPGSAQVPTSTGLTPGTSGAAPMPPTAPGLAPIGGGGLSTPPVVQAAPATQGTPTPPAPGVQPSAPQQAPAPAAPRGPVADIGWIQRNYGLAPGLELPKPENTAVPALFIAELPDEEAHLHRALASLRQQFEAAGWGQPIAVASIRRGFEVKTVYVTADGLSIHPHGVLLPAGVTPLDEMPGSPTHSELLGSLMVTDKLVRLIPREWTVEALLSTVPGGEHHQSTEQYQELVESEELLDCKVSRGRGDVTDDEALRVFARVAIGSAGCSDLDTENARIRTARWVGTQPAGYGEVLSRWYLADAAESMSAGRWGEAVYASEKYMNLAQSKMQAA